MEISFPKLLSTHISSFFDLLLGGNINSEPVLRRRYLEAEELMKQLNSLTEALVNIERPFDEKLCQPFEELIHFVDELIEHFENWQPFSSKVYFVLRSEDMMSKIEKYVLDVIQLLWASDEHFNATFGSSEQWVESITHKECEGTSSILENALKYEVEGGRPDSDVLVKIAERLNLTTNHEILIETVALEKLKENLEQNGEVEYIDKIIGLLIFIHELLITIKKSQICSPVEIPTDLFCPISLELMTDPVVVTSGQTYERRFIENWIELGLDVCPKTRQKLVNTNLFPNFTVKALITNWCEINNVKLLNPNPTCKVSLNQTMVSELKAEKRLNGEETSTTYATPASQGSSIDVEERQRGSSDLLVIKEEITQNSSRTSMEPIVISNLNSSPRILDDADEFQKVKSPFRLIDEAFRDQTDSTSKSSFVPQVVSSSEIRTSNDLYGIESEVKNLVEDLKSNSYDTVREATERLRLLTKVDMENRILIATYGAIRHLVDLLRSPHAKIQENSVTTLLNLSINDNNKSIISEANAIELLIHVLETGSSEARENSAATLYSISVIGDNKIKIGRSGAIGPLIELLEKGSLRGKKDATTALYSLSFSNENKVKIIEAGGVTRLVELMDPAAGMVDRAVSVLANLVTIPEGRKAIGKEIGGVHSLVEVVELGSARGKENAASALLHICSSSSKFCSMVLQEGVVPPLAVLSRSGTPRAREKAQMLLKYLITQKHGRTGRD